MDCTHCPKRNKCSGNDCYYDYHQEPDGQLAEDMARLDWLYRGKEVSDVK